MFSAPTRPRPNPFLSLLCVGSALVSGCQGATERNRRDAEPQTRAMTAGPDQWLSAGRDWHGTYHSPLTDINESTVGRLGFAWDYPLGFDRGQQSTPVVVGNRMYVSTNWGNVVALDATTGRKLWTYDPEVDGGWGRYACCDVVNRGLAVWQGRVYVGSTDAFLHAIDAKTGKRLWKVDTLDPADRAKHVPYTISGTPQIAGSLVVIGNGGADFGVRGFVRAFDLADGKRRWTFYTVPHDPRSGPQEARYLETALKSWSPRTNWRRGGGGTVWDGMAYDPALKLLYIGTGNASPYNAPERSPGGGDNLYLASIVAIDPETGSYRWHYQTVPTENWDYTATQKMILADIRIAGRMRQVLMQAPKNGFFYVLDRKTGELISAKPYTFVNWTKGLDPRTGKPIPNPAADYSATPRLVFPWEGGGHNWQPMSYDARNSLVFIPATDSGNIFINTEKQPIGEVDGQFSSPTLDIDSYDPAALRDHYGQLPPKAVVTAGLPSAATRPFLRAWDPVRQEMRWQVPLKGDWTGGVMSTDGDLVFQGDMTGNLHIYRAQSGKLLRSVFLGTGIMAAPMTYRIGAVQYVAVVAGYGGGQLAVPFAKESAAYRYGNAGRVIVLKLDGAAVPIPPPVIRGLVPAPPAIAFTAASAERGSVLYDRHCARCHAFAPAVLPDLRRLTPEKHAIFRSILLEGAFSSAGMGNFSDVLTPEDADAIQAYVLREAGAAHRAGRRD